MAKVLAWQCPHTKKLFDLDNEAAYRKHLAVLSASRKQARERVRAASEWDEWFRTRRADICTVSGIRKFAIDHYEQIFDGNRRGRKRSVPKLIDIQFGNMHYSDNARNTHSCPRGDKTQWDGRTKYSDGTLVPRGRPGVTGRVTFIYDCPTTGRVGHESATWGLIGIHTGTGGGGGEHKDYPGSYMLSYDVVIFVNDWEGMKEEIVVAKLKGEEAKVEL